MKTLLFTTLCLMLFALVQSIEENDEIQMLTVYKTVTASKSAVIGEIQNKEGPTASSSNEKAKPTVSLKVAEDEPAASSSIENKSTETPTIGEKLTGLNDSTTSSPIPDIEIEMEMEMEEEDAEEKENGVIKPMRLSPEVSSEKDGASPYKESSLVSELPSKSAPPSSGPVLASGSASASKHMSSSSASSSSSAFSFSPITLAPESTRTGGAKATAPVMNNRASAKIGAGKKENHKHASSALRITPSISSILFALLALILL